jgi:hypothetical protein
MADLEQPPLIEFPESQPLHQVRLVAENSPRRAWYHLSVRNLPGSGFLIVKTSGCRGGKGHIETWWRADYAKAMEKYYQLLKLKTRDGKRGREYKQETLQWPA